jgi:hypothetical protein
LLTRKKVGFSWKHFATAEEEARVIEEFNEHEDELVPNQKELTSRFV